MAQLTPMMSQYYEIKQEYEDHILFFRLGDFYEMFFDDAITASKELELTLTGRDCGQKDRAPMCGVPYHSCESYIARLVAKGYKVAICEQTEDPAQAKGIVRREVVRVITPGTITDSGMLDENKNNYIACIYINGDEAGLSLCDVSTGELKLTYFDHACVEALMGEIGTFCPKEVIINKETMLKTDLMLFLKERISCMVNALIEDWFDKNLCSEAISEQFGKRSEELGIMQDAEIHSLGAMLSYLKDTQKVNLTHINSIDMYSKNQFVEMDLSTRRNLELTETMLHKEKKGSLLGILDKTKTAMGGRLIRKWIEQPLVNVSAIIRRLNGVSALKNDCVALGEVGDLLCKIYDLERLTGKIIYGTANGRDLTALAQALSIAPQIKKILLPLKSEYIQDLCSSIEDISDVYDLVKKGIAAEPPFSIREGGIIASGYNEDVDRLRSLINDTKGHIARLENDQREKTGIKTLKIGYNKVFGYYIEITKSYFDMVPEDYIRKQTLANCERYITQELKEFESKVIGAHESIVALEYQLFCEIRDKIGKQTKRIQATAYAISQVDVLSSLAIAALENNYTMPDINCLDTVNIKEGRHPVVEKMQPSCMFVPNDTYLDCSKNRLSLITGPNMAGKSTYMRQSALIVLMAQIGSFVPASSAEIGVCDKIFTRVGASDDLAAGQSTFMVEMTEVANILRNATKKSFIIFDEIGRGTSTYDGLSIAQAVLEYAADKTKLGAKVMFATHYHELTDLEGVVEGVNNYSIAAKKRGDDIIFLRKIIRGSADDSYGIEVAKLAGVPKCIIERAKQVLDAIEGGEGNIRSKNKEKKKTLPSVQTEQISMGDMAYNAVIEKLKKVDLNVLTPIEALNILYDLKKNI